MAWFTVSKSADRWRRMSSDGESVSSAISMSFVTSNSQARSWRQDYTKWRNLFSSFGAVVDMVGMVERSRKVN